MKRILVPFDFSEPAINALRFALELASQSKGTVFLLNVIHLPVIQDSMLMPVITFEHYFMKGLQEKLILELNNLIAKYNENSVKAESNVEFGSIAQTITKFAENNLIDLIVMGSHGASGLREYVIGSNAEKVVRYSSAPVLIIKNYSQSSIENIVFPNTLETENQEGLIKKVKELQSFFNATVHILFVNTPTNFNSDLPTLSRLEAFAKRFMFKNYTINIFNHTFEEGGILDFTKSIKGDLIAMGTHGRKGISHIINGSLTEDVVNHSAWPIWTYASK